MSTTTSSAVPKDLEDYGRRATELDRHLAESASRLNHALQAFRDSHPDYGANLVDGFEARVYDLSSTAGELDAWVGRVGEAFRKADGRTTGGAPNGHPIFGPFLPGDDPNVPTKKVKDKDLAGQLRKEEKRDGFDLKANMKAGPRGDWFRLGAGINCWTHGEYHGGGYVLGPDGEKYWIMVPNFRAPDGRLYNADAGAIVGTDRVDTLGGEDSGWVSVGHREGTIELDHENFWSRFMAGAAASGGYQPLEGESVGKGEYEALYINPDTGEPVLLKGDQATLRRPGGGHDKLGLTIVQPDGTTRQIDPHSPDLTRAEYRNPLIQQERARRDVEEAIPAGVDATMMLAESTMTAIQLDNRDILRYQVVFEQNGDRRRAIVRTFHVTSAGGKFIIWPMDLYVDDKGHIQRHGVNYRQGAEIKPLDAPALVNTGADPPKS